MGENDGSAIVAPAQGVETQTPELKGGPAWMAQLPKDLQGNEKLSRFGAIGEVGKAYLELDGIKEKAIIPPGDGASEEELSSYYTKLGRPPTVEGYELKREIPKGMQGDQDYDKSFRTAAHKAGLSKAQAQAVYESVASYQNAKIAEGLKAAEDAKKAMVDKLRADWGPKFEENSALAARAFKELGSDELASFMEETGLGHHPVLMRAFHSIWGRIGDDNIVNGERPTEKKDLAHRMFPELP